MKKISICIPVFNEQENILNAYQKIKDIFHKEIKDYTYEIIFTDNHSYDDSEKIISTLCKNDESVKYIRFRKNLDYDKSILEGYFHSTGDAAIVIDCDLQDSPSLFKNFIEQWENGYDLVYGKVESRKENWIMNNLRKIYYILMNQSSFFNYPKDAHDFRLIDKKIINDLKKNNLLFPYVRGMTFSLASKSKGVPYKRNLRDKGKSKLGFYNSFTYAINAFLEETFLFTILFRRITLISIFLIIIFTFFNLIKNFIFFDIFQNLMIILIIFILSFLSIILEYITRIYFQLKKIKVNIYEKKINI